MTSPALLDKDFPVDRAHPCREPDCDKRTNEGKPFCKSHLMDRLPYAARLRAEVEAREAEQALAVKKGAKAIDPRGTIALELLACLSVEGEQELSHLRHVSGLNAATDAYVKALAREGLVIEGTRSVTRGRGYREREALIYLVGITQAGRKLVDHEEDTPMPATAIAREGARPHLQKMSDEQILELRAKGQSHGEIASAFGVTAEAVRARLKKLRALGADTEPDANLVKPTAREPVKRVNGPGGKKQVIDEKTLRGWRFEGRTIEWISRQLGVSETVVWRRCRELKISTKAVAIEPKLTDAQRAEIRRAFLANEASQHELAEKYGVGQTTISRACRGGRRGEPVAVPNGRGATVLVQPTEPDPTPEREPELTEEQRQANAARVLEEGRLVDGRRLERDRAEAARRHEVTARTEPGIAENDLDASVVAMGGGDGIVFRAPTNELQGALLAEVLEVYDRLIALSSGASAELGALECTLLARAVARITRRVSESA